MRTFEEIMNTQDLNELTPLEYCIWFTETGTLTANGKEAAAELARLTAIEKSHFVMAMMYHQVAHAYNGGGHDGGKDFRKCHNGWCMVADAALKGE